MRFSTLTPALTTLLFTSRINGAALPYSPMPPSYVSVPISPQPFTPPRIGTIVKPGSVAPQPFTQPLIMPAPGLNSYGYPSPPIMNTYNSIPVEPVVETYPLPEDVVYDHDTDSYSYGGFTGFPTDSIPSVTVVPSPVSLSTPVGSGVLNPPPSGIFPSINTSTSTSTISVELNTGVPTPPNFSLLPLKPIQHLVDPTFTALRVPTLSTLPTFATLVPPSSLASGASSAPVSAPSATGPVTISSTVSTPATPFQSLNFGPGPVILPSHLTIPFANSSSTSFAIATPIGSTASSASLTSLTVVPVPVIASTSYLTVLSSITFTSFLPAPSASTIRSFNSSSVVVASSGTGVSVVPVPATTNMIASQIITSVIQMTVFATAGGSATVVATPVASLASSVVATPDASVASSVVADPALSSVLAGLGSILPVSSASSTATDPLMSILPFFPSSATQSSFVTSTLLSTFSVPTALPSIISSLSSQLSVLSSQSTAIAASVTGTGISALPTGGALTTLLANGTTFGTPSSPPVTGGADLTDAATSNSLVSTLIQQILAYLMSAYGPGAATAPSPVASSSAAIHRMTTITTVSVATVF